MPSRMRARRATSLFCAPDLPDDRTGQHEQLGDVYRLHCHQVPVLDSLFTTYAQQKTTYSTDKVQRYDRGIVPSSCTSHLHATTPISNGRAKDSRGARDGHCSGTTFRFAQEHTKSAHTHFRRCSTRLVNHTGYRNFDVSSSTLVRT